MFFRKLIYVSQIILSTPIGLMFWQVDRGPGGLNLAPTQLLVSGCWSLVYGAIRCPKLTYYWLLSYGFIITSDFLNVFHGCPKNQSNKIKSWIYVSVDVCWSSSVAHLTQDTPMHTNSRLLNWISLGCKPPKSWTIALFLTVTEFISNQLPYYCKYSHGLNWN